MFQEPEISFDLGHAEPDISKKTFVSDVIKENAKIRGDHEFSLVIDKYFDTQKNKTLQTGAKKKGGMKQNQKTNEAIIIDIDYSNYFFKRRIRKYLYFHISELHRRRYLLRNTALEFFFSQLKSFFLICHFKEIDTIYNQVICFFFIYE
jgi:hypothetical protein